VALSALVACRGGALGERAAGLPLEFGDLSSDLITRASRVISQPSQQLLGVLGATLGITINTVIVLVLAAFLLLGGESVAMGLAGWLPRDWRQRVTGTLLEHTFRGYFAGQVLLALILSSGQILVFTLLKIPTACCLRSRSGSPPLIS